MFSGSAVVDSHNTSGLNPKGGPVMACFYTAAGDTSRQSAKQPFTQCLAYSLDGRTLAKYEANPILGNITSGNRDPKVIWHAPTKKWVMVLYVEVNKAHTIQFFNSPDLKHWTFLSQVDGFFECPDFFELPVDGKAGAKKWVLTAASSEYRVGTFDGQTFQAETDKLSGHLGQGFYAAQTYSDLPDGRRVQIGWLKAPAPGMPFNQCMTIPLELTLKSTDKGPRLAWQPVKEMNRLRGHTWSLGKTTLDPKAPNPAAKVNAELVEMRAEFRPATNSVTTFSLRGINLEYDGAKQELAVNGRRVAAPLRNGLQKLTVYIDRTAVEVFASDGLVYVPCPFIPATGNRSCEIVSKNAPTSFQKLEFHELKSIWVH
jgi:sucrose-6-phosphate hydrolase SacC (GH32 family)